MAVAQVIDNIRSSAIAVTGILAALYFIPSWPFMSDIVGPLVFALLMFLAHSQKTPSTLFRHIASGLIVAFALTIINETVAFAFSGSRLIGGNALDDAEIVQTLDGRTVMVVNLVLNSHALATFLFQSPITLMLTYMAVRHAIYPRFSLDYLLTLSRVVQGVSTNLGFILLLMIFGEFVSRSGLVLSQLIVAGSNPNLVLAASIGLSALIWFLFLVTRQSLDEIFN